MKINLTTCLLALTLGTTPLLAAPIASVLVSSNSLNVPMTGALASTAKVTFGGKVTTWHQLGKTNVIVDLPANLPGGMYSLVLPGHTAYPVSIGTQQGPAGPAGAQGSQGDQGIQGPQGDQGIQGSAGDTGSQGLPGSQGVQGPQGDQGPQGLTGNTGANGIDGINGTNGVDGLNGTNGLDGTNGLNGVDGLNGTNGLNGVDGTNGINGLNGTNGLNGVDGTNGINGLNGTNGLNGINGTNGVNGQNGSLTVNSFIYAYDTGTASVANNSLIGFSSYGANTGGGDSWSANGSAFVIPSNGVYQIQFSLNAAKSTHTFALDITDSPNSLVQAGVDAGYFQYESTGGSSTAKLNGEVLVNCSAGDIISLKNVGGFTFTYGNGVPTNAPSATLSILQIH